MIRICNGEVYNVGLDDCTSENMDRIFRQFGSDVRIQIVDGNNKFVGMFCYEDFMGSGKVDSACVKLDPDFFRNARKLFFDYEKEYLPVLNDRYELECFCYDDNLSWNYYDYQLLLEDREIAGKVFAGIGCIHIWGLNEWAFHLAGSLRNVGIPFRVHGEFWEECGILSTAGEEAGGEGAYHFRCEGYQDLKLSDLGFWKHDLPPEEYADIEGRIMRLVRENKIFSSPAVDAAAVHRVIGDAIRNKTPFCVSRLGYTEAQVAGCSENGFYDKLWLKWLYTTSGFFSKGQPGDIILSDVDAYVERTREGIRNTDVNIVFSEIATAYLVNKYAGGQLVNAPIGEISIINSEEEELWTHALEGKKVLVISSFSETVQRQYRVKDELFARKILPDFDLLTLQTHETQVGNHAGFESWEDSYRCLLGKVKEIDFDVALISAGAYGYPLASDIKNLGKVAVELCSSLAPLFGIKMKRHDVRYEVNRHWNEYWSYPVEKGPDNKNVIEYGCYWRG